MINAPTLSLPTYTYRRASRKRLHVVIVSFAYDDSKEELIIRGVMMKLNLLFSEITSPFYERAHTHTTDDRCKGQKGLERRTEKAECTTGEGGGGGCTHVPEK